MSVPEAPPQNPRMTRHSTRLMAIAREMYGDGNSWTPTQIRRWMEENIDGPTPHLNTIRIWVVPGCAEEHRRQNMEAQRRKRSAASKDGAGAASRRLSARELERQMLLLRREGLSFSAIATVVAVYHAEPLTEHQVRFRLQKQGVPRSAAKSAATRKLWMQDHYRRPATAQS